MEILSDILKSLRVSGSVYFCDHVEDPWTKEFIEPTTASFHLIRRGLCWVKVGEQINQLSSGDLIFLGPGVDHILTSQPPHGQSYNKNENTLLLCGYCSFQEDTLTPLKQIFPEVLIVKEEELHKHPWLKATFDQISAEYMSQNPGTEIIVNKLTEVVLVELIRINFCRKDQNSFLLALNDKRISKSLKLIHSTPQEPWTLESLASQIGMSRAAFAKRFKEMIGEPMFAYLSKVRVQKAKELLQDTKLFVNDIAFTVGYESERAFAKTFGKHVGMTPKQYRMKVRGQVV